VAKLNGSDTFFKFADLVFNNQTALTPQTSDSTLNDAATKVGTDAAKVGSCALTPEAKASVDASIKLAQSLNVNETPTLFVNGRGVPMGAAPYETLQKIVAFQEKEDK
jgi:protein-disulfide isomerase